MSSKAAAERNQRILLELLRLPGNDRCADCRTPNPRWASWNLGIFLCVQCAGVHRKMGTHISKVRSLTLDQWTREQVDAMKAGGNAKSNALYNPDEMRNRPPTNIEQSERGSELERYIRKKYEFKKFMDRGPPPVPQKDPPNMQRKTSSLASPRAPQGRSPTMPSPSPSSSSIQSFPDSFSPKAAAASSSRPPPSPAPSQPSRTGVGGPLASASAPSLSVPPRSSSSLTPSTANGSSTRTNSANLLIPDIDAIPTQPSPSPTIALFPPTQQQQHHMLQAQHTAIVSSAYSPVASSTAFMDAFSVAAAAAGGNGTPQTPGSMMSSGMGMVPSASPSLSPFGHTHQQQQQGFGLGVGLSPMATGATMSSGSVYSPSPSPSIPGFGHPTNPFQQQQQQHQMQMQMGGMNVGTSLGMPYGGFPAAAASTGALGLPFSPGGGGGGGGGIQSSYSASSSPAPFSQPLHAGQQQQMFVSSPMSPGGGMMVPQQQQQQQLMQGVQPQPTGFDMFANGMMPAHMRTQNGGAQQRQFGGGVWG
ncbi:Protein gts1 [Tilletia horrida]|nr:Protein gts1 [Tilletia horrida]